MEPLQISQLATLNFDVRRIYCGKWTYAPMAKTDFSVKGRPQNLLCVILSGNRTYVSESKTVTFPKGSVLFIPNGTHYISYPFPTKDEPCTVISAGFDLVDEAGDLIQLEHGIYDEWGMHQDIAALLETLNRTVLETPYHVIKKKVLLLRILSAIIFHGAGNGPSRRALKPAISFILEHYCENLPIKAYADACHMSESYFRKKFVEHIGKSPLEYRNELRFARARTMYTEGHSTQEIAEAVGFCDANYLAKIYKKRYGHSLKEDCDLDFI